QLGAAIAQDGEERIDALEALRLHRARARGEGAELEVLRDGHAAEEPAPFGHQGQAALDDLMRAQRAEVLSFPADGTGARTQQAGDGLEQRALARAVGAEQ